MRFLSHSCALLLAVACISSFAAAQAYRTESPPYVIIGALVEARVRRARVFLNFENLGDTRQTRYDPLVLPIRGLGGRWTTDTWTELAGRTINGGVRLAF